MKVNEIETRNYTTHFRGRAWDNVTEFAYISPANLNKEQFMNLLEQNKITLQGGWVSFIKKRLTLKTGKTLYKHVAKLECSVN